MDNKTLSICIGVDDGYKYEKFAEALDQEIKNNPSITYQIRNLERHDWIEKVKPFDMVIWWPGYMGPYPVSLFKEKIYFLENFLKKLVIPNFKSIWHFESKIAQSYLFKYADISIPHTVVSFDYHDSLEQLNSFNYPIIKKKSFGAASSNVKLIKDKKSAGRELDSIFYQSVWEENKVKTTTRLLQISKSITKGWFFKKLWAKLTTDNTLGGKFGNVYLQEFIPGNSADLRITAIGDRYALGFWRNNRPGDFRASGSGRIDHERPLPEELIHSCLNINQKLGFDTMAYDIIFKESQYVITEMSYSYIPKYLYDSEGFYELKKAGELEFQRRHTWPQELWIKWALIRAG